MVTRSVTFWPYSWAMTTLRGFATISLFADDHAKATRWYAEFLGLEPYFERPGYAEFRIGDYQHEIGIIDRRFVPHMGKAGPAGAIAYWHVDDVAGTLAKLLSLGATELEKLTERGGGFVTASVVDPFGNVIGVMHNPHYLKVLESR